MNPKPRHALIFSFIFLLAANPVAAQSNSSQSSTPTDYRASFDDATRIVNVTWTNTGVELVFESDIPRMAVITDANSASDTGVSQIQYKEVRLGVGRTKVKMDLESDSGSMTAWIGVEGTYMAVSNPTQPLFEEITRSHFYLGLIFAPISMAIQVFTRRFLGRYLLKRNLIRVA